MEARVCPSKKICRFDLPMDFRQLENGLDGYAPDQFRIQASLHRAITAGFCRVCKRKSNLYRRLFEKFDKDRDGLLSLKGMERGICDLYMADVTSSS